MNHRSGPLAANLEWLFTEAGDTAARVRAAAAHGFSAVEIWGWRDKDVPALASALDETGVELLSMIVDPKVDLTDPALHEGYLRGVRQSLAAARTLHPRFLVVVAGDELPGRDRAAQRASVVSVLAQAAELAAAEGAVLLLENLNSRVDHVGTFIDSAAEAVEIVQEVGSPGLRVLLDAYHAWVMEEDLEAVLRGHVDLIGHVQIADVPGRHEPGSGGVDWAQQLALLRSLGYDGAWGLEYLPTTSTTASLRHIEHVTAAAP